MNVTLKDIAQASQVSISTASRALNGHPGIRSATAERVREVAERMNYKGRQIDTGSGSLDGIEVGIFCLGMGSSLTALPTVASTIAGAEKSLGSVGARTMLATIPKLETPPEVLLSRLPDALILEGALQGDVIGATQSAFVDKLRSLPTVWVLGRPLHAWGDVVGSNDYEVGAMAAQTLLDAGHRRLAFINPKPDHLLFQRREDGFRAAARRGGAESVLSFSESPIGVWHLPLQVPEHVEVVQSLIDKAIAAKPRPTGIFAAADSIAALVYRALAIRGLAVRRDFSLVSGNNDVALIAGLHPALTTCDVDAFAIGQHAVRQLAMRLSHGPDAPDTEILLAPKLVEGESVKSLNWKHMSR